MIEPIRAEVEQTPTARFLIEVGYNSLLKRYRMENDIVT